MGAEIDGSTALTVSPGPTPRAKQWADGLNLPMGGSRHFSPRSFEVTLDVAEVIPSFEYSAAHVARIMHCGRIKACTVFTLLHPTHGAALYAYTKETALYGTFNYTMHTTLTHTPLTQTLLTLHTRTLTQS